ncbi:class I SAM-dependent methyltransferase [Fibrobacterota bacterium]
MEKTEQERVDHFVARFRERAPLFCKEIQRALKEDGDLFSELAGPMLAWASVMLGPSYEDILIDKYSDFVLNVNMSQFEYEKKGKYQFSSWQEVYEKTYDQKDFMDSYHWGVYTHTFAWYHHLKIYEFFRDKFLLPMAARKEGGRLLDLGAGSGIWHLLANRHLPQWDITAVDISETSIGLSREMAQKTVPEASIEHFCADATAFQASAPADAAICCFLMEHLERPEEVLNNISRNLKERCFAFVTCGLTGAEIDHIFEFKRESEPILMAEQAGLRVVRMFSASPSRVLQKRKYLPRSLAMVVQKRKNEIW